MNFPVSVKTIERSADIVAPPKRQSVSEWVEENGFLPEEGNAEPGKVRLARMPHEQEMLDDPLEPGVRDIFWMLASQAGGKTFCIIFLCEYVIAVLRKSMLVVRATKETALEWIRDKFLPTSRATPAMAGLLKETRARDSESTALNRRYPGGRIKVAGAKSPATLRGGTCGIVFQDEIDSYLTTKEGDPLKLADRAAITFRNAWKLKASTPTLEGFSRVAAGYERGDKKRYFLPCPVCGEFQVLSFFPDGDFGEEKEFQGCLKFSFTAEEYARFENAPDPAAVPSQYEWEAGEFPIRDPRRAFYVCKYCRHGWNDTQRIQSYLSGHQDNAPVLVNGKELRAHWRATAEFKGTRSRHLSGMYLVMGLEKDYDNFFHQFAQNFLTAKEDGRETLMVWYNTFLAVVFREAGQKTDWKTLKERAEDYDANTELPAQVLWIAFSVDVQPDRVEILWLGWGEHQEVWALDYHVIYGDLDMPSMQEKLSEYLFNKRFKHPILGNLSFKAGGIDSAHQTKIQAVYQFAGKYRGRNIFAVRGFDDALGAVYRAVQERRFGGLRVNLNVDYLKTHLFERLNNKEPGPRYIHFPKQEVMLRAPDGTETKVKTRFDSRFYMGLCSEKRFPIKQPNGGYKYQWRKVTSSARNEQLDTMVYGLGIYEFAGEDEWIRRKWREISEKLAEKNPPVQPPGPPQPPEEKLPKASEPPVEKKLPELQKAKAGPPRRRRIVIKSPFRNPFRQ